MRRVLLAARRIVGRFVGIPAVIARLDRTERSAVERDATAVAAAEAMAEEIEALRHELLALRKDLAATNRRIDWIEAPEHGSAD